MDPEIRNAEESTLFKAPFDESTGTLDSGDAKALCKAWDVQR